MEETLHSQNKMEGLSFFDKPLTVPMTLSKSPPISILNHLFRKVSLEICNPQYSFHSEAICC